MKRTLIFVVTLGVALLLFTNPSSAQLFPHLVFGKVFNPDNSVPDSAEVKFAAYLTKSPLDTTFGVCSDSGGWAVNTVHDFLLSEWEVGDTLYIEFINIDTTGDFFEARSWTEYITTDISPEYVANFVLPVDLTAFEAIVERSVTGDRVCLKWNTLGESNNFGFQVLKSDDGHQFKKIGFVAGAGSTNAPRSYEFVDQEVKVGTLFYRLKQIDTNGSFELSDTKEVVISLHRNTTNWAKITPIHLTQAPRSCFD